MRDAAVGDLVRKMRGGRITRRHFIERAGALGLSATAISSVLRANPSRAQGASEVTFWTTHSEPDLTPLQNIVDAFNKENSDVQAKLVQVVGDETDTTKLMTAVRGGTGPDVYMLDRFIVAQRAAEGVLQDLSSFIGSEDLSQTYIPFAWAEANFNGKPFALPFDTDARALFYNATWLQAAGVDMTPLDAANGPITFEALTEIANGLNEIDQDGNFSKMGFVPYTHQGWHYTYGFAYGGTFFDSASCQVTPDQEGVVAGHQWLYDYTKALDPQKVNAFAGPYAATESVPEEQDLFVTQRVAFAVTGDWFLNTMAKFAPDVEYGTTLIPIPKEGDSSATWAGGWSMVIPQGAKNPEGAWKFLQFIAGEPGQRTYTTESDHLPTIQSLLEESDLFDERHLFFAEQLLPTAKNRPPLPVGAKYWDELTTAWQKIYLNQEEPASALATAKQRVQPDLDRYCPITATESS
jgi:multiple sugar transport system substrate-binding protein